MQFVSFSDVIVHSIGWEYKLKSRGKGLIREFTLIDANFKGKA